MNGIPSASAVSCSSSNADRVERRPALDHRAAPEAVPAQLLLVEVGLVGRERHVDDDHEVGLQRERRRPRARERDLLLRHRQRAHVGGRVARLGHQPRGLVGHVATEAVVHRARDHPAVRELDRLAGDHRDVADAHERARVVAVLRADVDVQVLELRRLLALLAVEQVDRPLADHAGDRPLARQDVEPLADEHDRVPAADRREPQVAVVVDVVDDQPDLVDVPGDRQHRPVARPADARDGRADRVLRDVGERRARVAEHCRGRLLVAGRACRGQQAAKDVGDAHASSAISCRSTNGRIPPCR